METFQLIVQLIIAIVPMIPLVIALVKYIIKAVQEKNWRQMVNLALKLIGEAEGMFTTGAEKKAYVIKMVKAAAKELNYEIDEESLSNLIDSIIDITKTVNVKQIEG